MVQESQKSLDQVSDCVRDRHSDCGYRLWLTDNGCLLNLPGTKIYFAFFMHAIMPYDMRGIGMIIFQAPPKRRLIYDRFAKHHV